MLFALFRRYGEKLELVVHCASWFSPPNVQDFIRRTFLDCFAKGADTKKNCKRVIGDVNFEEISPEKWQHVETLEGTLRVEGTDIENLNIIRNLKIVGWMSAFHIQFGAES